MCVSHSVMFNSLWPPRTVAHQAPLWNSPGKNTGVYSHSLLQGIFPTQGSNLDLLLHCRQFLYHLSHEGSPRIVSMHNQWNTLEIDTHTYDQLIFNQRRKGSLFRNEPEIIGRPSAKKKKKERKPQSISHTIYLCILIFISISNSLVVYWDPSSCTVQPK